MKKHTHTAPGIEEFKKLLKKHSLKSTQQRLAVHNAMLKLGHASADMVTEEIKSQGTTNVTVASVYNILSQIALLGIYDHRMSANNKMYFDVNTFRHIHLYDYVNNTFKDVIDDDFMDNLDAYFAKKKFKGYRVECVDVQIVCRPSRSYVKKNTSEKLAE